MPLLLLALLAVPLFPSAARSSGADVAAVTSVRGQVTIKRPGSPVIDKPAQGAGLGVGDEVRTADSGLCQLSLADDTVINLGHRSVARIIQFSFNERTDRRSAVLQVLEGHARIISYKVRSRDSSIRVEAGPATVILDDLADLVVIVSSAGTEAAVLQGGARVKSRLPYIAGEVRLRENQRSRITAKQPPSSPSVVSVRERHDILRIWKGL